jgi:hypothetical protein
MYFRPIELCDFWTMPWSDPFRAACCWVVLLGAPLQGSKPDTDAPGWLRPLLVQRWVGQTIAARLAWLGAHPEARATRFGDEAQPIWLADGWVDHQRRWLRSQHDDMLLRLVAIEAERLTRIAQEAPTIVGSAHWTGAALGAFARIAQLYRELKRRHHAMPARTMLRAELQRFVEWSGSPEGVPAACESARETDVVLAEW